MGQGEGRMAMDLTGLLPLQKHKILFLLLFIALFIAIRTLESSALPPTRRIGAPGTGWYFKKF